MGDRIRRERAVGSAPTVALFGSDGTSAGEMSLSAEVFALTLNVPVMHQVVNAQLAARRAGTQSTKTRAEVSGGGAKPWRQKGTGRARQGSIRAPQFSGGGVALGPKPRSYRQRTPKKMVQLALRCALSDRAAEGNVLVVDRFAFEAPRTKDAVAFLDALGVTGKVLVVLGDEDEMAYLSFRNLQRVHVLYAGELNAYDVLRHDQIIFTQATLPTGSATAGPEAAGTAVESSVEPVTVPQASKRPASVADDEAVVAPEGNEV